jgi:hypothetical protein
MKKDGLISIPQNLTKGHIRRRHNYARIEKLLSEKAFIKKHFNQLSNYFADGTSINPEKFKPVIYSVKPNTEFSDLFRFATLLWSVPVSHGYGRRLKFVVIDEHNGKLVGLFALGDPIFNLSVRDKWIGWDQQMRAERLYNVMDLFVVGAVPPYSQLLCGKLMAMLATSSEVRKILWHKYRNTETTIRKETKIPHLVLLTTSSALGRSSLYNRITFNGKPLFIKIGETIGWGHFHLSNGSFKLMRDYLSYIEHPINKSHRFGQGPNWKIRAIRTCLQLLELSPDLLMHGIKREVYIVPLAENYKEFLLGESKRPMYYEMNKESLIDFFIQRWLLPRSFRNNEYKSVKTKNILKEIKNIAEDKEVQ